MNVRIRKMHPAARLPTYGSHGAGAFDLYAAEVPEGYDIPRDPDGGIVVCTSSPAISTGLAFEIPQGWVMLVFSRSGHGFNHATRLANCVGVIDSDYRGEVKVKLTRDFGTGGHLLSVKAGDRIAQAMIVQAPRCSFIEAEGLTETARGASGFGSTGA